MSTSLNFILSSVKQKSHLPYRIAITVRESIWKTASPHMWHMGEAWYSAVIIGVSIPLACRLPLETLECQGHRYAFDLYWVSSLEWEAVGYGGMGRVEVRSWNSSFSTNVSDVWLQAGYIPSCFLIYKIVKIMPISESCCEAQVRQYSGWDWMSIKCY